MAKVARCSPRGCVTAAFGVPMGGAFRYNAVAVQGDGKVVVGGEGPAVQAGQCVRLGSLAVTRYTADGRPDGSFGAGGEATTKIGSLVFTDAVPYKSAIAIQSDGTIVVVGGSRLCGRDRDFVIARYDPDGKLDS